MFHPIRWSCALLAVLTFSGCQRSVSAPKPAEPGAGAGRFWTVDSELAKRYGSLPGRVVDEREDGLEAQAEVCLRHEFDDHGERAAWVAVCGQVLEAPHAEPGWIDLFVMRGPRDSLKVVADTFHLESGSFGKPGGVSLVRLGAGRWGFVLTSQFTGMGEIIESESWFAPQSAGMREVVSTQTYSSNEGALPCEEDSLGCRWERRWLRIDSSNRGSDRFPIQLVDSLRSQGKVIARQQNVGFRADSGRYELPEPLSTRSEEP